MRRFAPNSPRAKTTFARGSLIEVRGSQIKVTVKLSTASERRILHGAGKRDGVRKRTSAWSGSITPSSASTSCAASLCSSEVTSAWCAYRRATVSSGGRLGASTVNMTQLW